jgi:hypothetical protein
MPNSPAADIASHIMAANIATFLPSTTLPFLAVGFEPDVQDRVIVTVYDVGGGNPEPKYQRDYPHIQVRVKAKREYDYPSAYDTQQKVRDLLLGMERQTIGGTLYVGCWQIGDIGSLAPDYNMRSILVANYRFAREYSTPNRLPIE